MLFFFFFNDTATTEIYTLSLHDALPICFARFIKSALKAGQAVVVVATESHRVSLLQRLEAYGVDVSVAVERKRYIQLDVPDTHSPIQFAKLVNDLVVAASKAADGEHPRVAAG